MRVPLVALASPGTGADLLIGSLVAFGLASIVACARPDAVPRPDDDRGASERPSRPAHPPSTAATDFAASHDPELADALARIRAATERFRDLDAAVAAGYPEDGGRCLDRPPEGAMGFHHIHAGLMDATLELERPEILVYERTADGGYELTGVEYAVPFDAWTGAAPPRILGQELKPAPGLGIWYLHVWVWRANPNGLFADWNPAVRC